MATEDDENFRAMQARLADLLPRLNERDRRAALAVEAKSWGYGGISAVHQATGVSRGAIRRGMTELADDPTERSSGRVRAPGGGRKKVEVADPGLLDTLESLIEPETWGDPESPLRWTTKSTRHLAGELTKMGHSVSHSVVAKILHSLRYSLQGTRKKLEGSQHPDRDDQFRYINTVAKEFLAAGDPVISVDTKKKELVGRYAQSGKEWNPQGEPVEVSTYDFPSDADGKAIPYGVYDLTDDSAWVSVGIDHDTSVFAVATIGKWWQHMGKEKYPDARRIFITADGGGSNGHRPWLWKYELAQLATATGLEIVISHYPPGTSKWNKIEHRLFSRITCNWRGRPLETYQTIVNLIANTTTTTGLTVRCELDPNLYPTKIKLTDQQLAGPTWARAAMSTGTSLMEGTNMADTTEAEGCRVLYFDYQATTPVDPGVVAAMLPFFSGQFGNAGSRHNYGTAAAFHVAAARQQVAQLIGALSSDEIVFTAGATESNAITIRKIFAAAERNHFITTAIEHPSVLGPAAELVQAGHEVSYLVVDCHGRVDPVQVESLIRPETRLVSVMHANNEVGTIQPLADISRITRAAGILLHADLTQTAGALEVDVQELGVDLASFSAHKFYGPKGIGALYVRRGCSLGKGPGSTESALRTGTLNVPGIVGMGTAAELAVDRRLADRIHTVTLRTWFAEALLAAMPDAFVNGHPTERIPGNLSVTFPGVEVDEVLRADPGLGLAMGSSCTSGRTEPSHVLLALGLSRALARSTLRIGFGRATEWDDCHECVERLVPLLMRSRSRSRAGQKVSTGRAR